MYLGGKFRIRKQIGEYINALAGDREYIEPFVGAGNVLSTVRSRKRTALDANEAPITMYNALKRGWTPPLAVSEEEYRAYNGSRDAKDPMTAFVGFGCSFGGKWFGGYARSDQGQDYAGGSRASLLRKFATMGGVCFKHADYRTLTPNGAIIYCDPPYAGATGYGAVGEFDSAEFWGVMRKWSTNNIVLVSEITAPPDFVAVAKFEARRTMRTSTNGAEMKVEKLFQYSGARARRKADV